MPAVALSRVGARVVESGPDGEDLAAGTWQRLEALPDPRSPRGRIYPLACLVAIAICAFTVAGNDRFSAVGQWIRRASQACLARLRAPWDPIAGGWVTAPRATSTRPHRSRLLTGRDRRRSPSEGLPAGSRSPRSNRALSDECRRSW